MRRATGRYIDVREAVRAATELRGLERRLDRSPEDSLERFLLVPHGAVAEARRRALAVGRRAAALAFIHGDGDDALLPVPSHSSPEEGGKPEGERRLVEAAGVGLDRVFKTRPVSALWPTIAPAQDPRSAEHAFHSPKSAPAARELRPAPAQRAMIRSNPETLSARDYAGAP